MHYYAWPYEKIIQARHYTMSYTHSRDFLTPFTPLYFWAAFKSAFWFWIPYLYCLWNKLDIFYIWYSFLYTCMVIVLWAVIWSSCPLVGPLCQNMITVSKDQLSIFNLIITCVSANNFNSYTCNHILTRCNFLTVRYVRWLCWLVRYLERLVGY